MPNFILILFSAKFHCKSVLVPASGLRVATVIVLSCYGTVTPHLLKIIAPNFIILLYSAKLHCKSVCTGAGTWCYFSYKKLCTTFFCFHIPYDMVYGIPTVPRRAWEKPLLQIIHGPCIFLQFFVCAGTSTSSMLSMEYLMFIHWPARSHSSTSLMVRVYCCNSLWLQAQACPHCTGGVLDVLFTNKRQCMSIFCFHIPYDMVYGIPWAREMPLLLISHGGCSILPVFVIADTSSSLAAEHMISFCVGKAMIWLEAERIYDIIYGLCANTVQQTLLFISHGHW